VGKRGGGGKQEKKTPQVFQGTVFEGKLPNVKTENKTQNKGCCKKNQIEKSHPNKKKKRKNFVKKPKERGPESK